MKALYNYPKVALILCGGNINYTDLPIAKSRSNAMIPVNGKPVIGWILDDLLKRKIAEVIFVLRIDNYKLFNYLECAFAKRIIIHFAFIQSGTILESLLTGLSWVLPEHGVHIILGDTLLRDPFPDKPDFVFVGEYENPRDWCLVERDFNGNAKTYFDKTEVATKGLRALVGIYSLSDTALLKSIIEETIKNGSKEISRVLALYGEHHAIAVIDSNEWYDFGHPNYFNLAKCKLLQTRYFNSLEIDPVRATITKRSKNNEKLVDELAWYKKLPADLQLLCPRLIENSDDNKVSIKLEYYGYPNLAELYVFGDIGLSAWMSALKRLMEIHLLFKNEKGKLERSDIMEMYWDKTNSRLNEIQVNSLWRKLLNHKTIAINGKNYKNFFSLSEAIHEFATKISKANQGCIIHGDYCFSNILYDFNSQIVRLIDPRGSFGKQKIHGDPRYDMAKLRHSVSGCYDVILADLFLMEQDSNNFSLQIFKPEIYQSLCQYLDELLAQHGYDTKEIKFIEGLLFISMVPLHNENQRRQLAMYLNGITILNQVLEYENSDRP